MKQVLRPDAAADVEEAHRWYELQRAGLGEEFLVAVQCTLDAVSEHPEHYAVCHRDTRRARVRRFPYCLYYRVLGDQVVIVACLHGRRDSRRWQKRS